MSVPVVIRLLGGFRLSVAGRDVASLPRKAQALLAVLATQDGRPITRETVSDLLWTDRGVEQARHSLRQTLLVLRREMPNAISNDPRVLSFVPGMVETDLGRFRLLSRDADRSALAEAGQLYEGALLDGFSPVGGEFDEWLRNTRDGLNDQAIEVFRRLADACLAAGDAHPAVLAAERMLELDLLREDSHRKLMEMYLRAGRRSDAIRQYDVCVEVLRRELDVAPSAETEVLGRKLRERSEILAVPDGTLPGIEERRTGARFKSGPPRVAVLPFHQIGEVRLEDHIADGMVEDVVFQLASIRDLSVISHGTTITLKGTTADVRKVSADLGADYVVRGSVRRTGAVARILTELTDSTSGEVIWARSNDVPAGITFADQDRIVAQIVNSLAPRVQDTELVRIRGKRLNDLTLYEGVLLVRDLLTTLREDDFRRSRQILDDIMTQEPSWGEAYALAADWYGLFVAQGWSSNRSEDLKKVDVLARRALALDNDNLRALVFYGHRRSLLYRDYGTARTLFQRALDVAPSSAAAWLWSSYTYSFIDEPDEALRRAERALELSPRDREAHRFFAAMCIAHYTAGNFDAAAEWGMRTMSEPLVGRTTGGWVAASLVAAGRLDDAREVMHQTMARWPERRVADVVRNHAYRDPDRREQYGRHLLAAGFPE